MKKILSFVIAFVALVTLASCINLSSVDYLQVEGDLPDHVLVNEKVDLSNIKIYAKMNGNDEATLLDLSKVEVTGDTPTTVGKNVCTLGYENASATITYYAYKKALSLSELETANDGDYLFYPKGIYETTDRIEINSNIVVLGEEGTKFQMAKNDNGGFDYYVPNSGGTFYMFNITGNVSFKGISFVGLCGTGQYEGSYRLETCITTSIDENELSILNCTFTDFCKSVLVIYDNTKLVFDNNYLNYTSESNSLRAPNAIQINSGCNVTITNNTINGFYNPNAPLDSLGVWIYGASQFVIEGNTFINCGGSIAFSNLFESKNTKLEKIDGSYVITVDEVSETLIAGKEYINDSEYGSYINVACFADSDLLKDNTLINSTISDLYIYLYN